MRVDWSDLAHEQLDERDEDAVYITMVLHDRHHLDVEGLG